MAGLSPGGKSVLLSKPFDIYWGGWRATSTHLQQAGWELSAEEDVVRQGVRIALRHKDWQLYAVSSAIRFDFLAHSHQSFHSGLPDVRIEYMSNKVTVQVTDDFTNFKPIDAYPQVTDVERKDIEDFSMFATPLVRTEEIIIEPESVAECMEIIKRLQKPEQAAIRDRQRLRESREAREIGAVPRQKFHAQILSIV